MTAHVQRHAPHERLLSQQGLEHANQFSALLIDRRCVEVVDRLVRIRLHGVGRRSGVFAKLAVAQHRHIVDAIQSAAVQISAEALIAKNSQPLFERQLKPVTTGDAVAGPVVKIFMSDHAFDAF